MIKSRWRWTHMFCWKALSPPRTSSRGLPDDLIIEILLRLPAKSLFRFKSVCRNWLAFISNSQFTKTHFKNTQTASGDFSRHRLIAHSSKKNDPQKMISVPFHSILGKSAYKKVRLKTPSETIIPEFVVGSYNGLICVVSQIYIIVLWNPYIRRYYKVPNDPIIQKLVGKYFTSAFGFYFDENSDDYKIIVIRNSFTEKKMFLWSSKTSSWKNIQTFPGYETEDPRGICVNGKIHWTVCDNNSYKILAFDVKSETFEELPMPTTDIFFFRPILAIYRGMLSVVCRCKFPKGESTGLWVRRNYRSVNCWRKELFLPLIETPWPSYLSIEVALHLNSTFRMFITSNSELFLLDEDTFPLFVRRMTKLLIGYNGRQIAVPTGESTFYFQVPTFVESLVSPFISKTEPTNLLGRCI